MYKYIVLSVNLALFIDKNKTVYLVCFNALPESRKIFKNMLLLDYWTDATMQNYLPK